VRIERIDGELALVEGRAASVARWRWRAEEVELASTSGLAYVVPSHEVPAEIAVGLLGLRDAARYISSGAAELPGEFALRAWLDSSRHPLLLRVFERGDRPSWTVYRFAFVAAATLGSRG
jgi:hypothetical protein